MHDIWNPWHGCHKISEGCAFCYMYCMDKKRGKSGGDIFRTKGAFDYPLQKDRSGAFKVKSGEMLRVCMTSDFFLEEADEWRPDAWNIIRARPDVSFYLLTKRIERVKDCLPPNWERDANGGWENVFFNVTAENQARADERVPLLLELPFKHKGVNCAPLIGEVSLEKWLGCGLIERVGCGGENYDGTRPCHFEWVQALRAECVRHNVTFSFIETGTNFVKDGKTYMLHGKRLQSEMAHKSGMNFMGKPLDFSLKDIYGRTIPPEAMYTPFFKPHCATCGSRTVCNGCGKCNSCFME